MNTPLAITAFMLFGLAILSFALFRRAYGGNEFEDRMVYARALVTTALVGVGLVCLFAASGVLSSVTLVIAALSITLFLVLQIALTRAIRRHYSELVQQGLALPKGVDEIAVRRSMEGAQRPPSTRDSK